MERMFINGVRLEREDSTYRLYDSTGRQLVAQFRIVDGQFRITYGTVGTLMQELIMAKIGHPVHS